MFVLNSVCLNVLKKKSVTPSRNVWFPIRAGPTMTAGRVSFAGGPKVDEKEDQASWALELDKEHVGLLKRAALLTLYCISV